MALQAVAQEVKYMEKLYEWIENPARYAWNQEEGRSYYIPPQAPLAQRDVEVLLQRYPRGNTPEIL